MRAGVSRALVFVGRRDDCRPAAAAAALKELPRALFSREQCAFCWTLIFTASERRYEFVFHFTWESCVRDAAR